MAYTALYRKFRPQGFEDVKGQEHIVGTLRNQVNAGRIGHAYLFCGTRGTGKTTVAKIFARAVNCEHPKDGSPCGECPSCRAIQEGRSLNVVEIDAASNNRVEDVRVLLEEVEYPPTDGKYKVYIIDEAQMLTPSASNALLKTLEEPPSYAVFILATTEPQKILLTIMSRCQRYDFHRITLDVIAGRLEELLAAEQVEAEEKAVRYIAKAGDGSMRDAISLLDRCISFYWGQKLTYDKVLDILGAVDTEVFGQILRLILSQDVSGAIAKLDGMILQGKEPSQFVADFTWYLRDLLLLQSSDDMEDVLDISTENLAQMKEEAQLVDGNDLMRFIRIFSELSNQLRYATQKRILIEVTLVKLCRPQMEENVEGLAARVRELERRIDQGAAALANGQISGIGADGKAAVNGQAAGIGTSGEVANGQAVGYGGQTMASGQTAGVGADGELASGQAPGMGQADARPGSMAPRAVPEDLRQVVRQWDAILQDLPQALRQFLKQAILCPDGDNVLMLVFEDELASGFVNTEEHLQMLRDAIRGKIGKEIELQVKQSESPAPAEDTFIDLRKVINMDIELDDDEEEKGSWDWD